ncbi:PIG-L deacetylase family protein [Pseudazoarcus pumilus]|uniref:PIG-L family deacetylase n=1 Tax=Pseudazoarcus pumilus TaxID=2067960 RepID=A0A2I6S7S8_9RHOO|nr:PIG-L family deacetylase [Pseudazoarcus pumilus]AUN95316.1 PIG-L family deacetylase [Pseudazoarcus pumilus]
MRPAPRELTELDLPGCGHLAVLAPHPDDFDAIAVTMRHFARRGWRIRLAVLTSGASGVEDGYRGARSIADKTALREAEQRSSCHVFGLPPDDLHFLRLDGAGGDAFAVDSASLARVRAFLRTAQPTRVFMPHGDDANLAHRRTWELFRTIAREDGLAVEAWLNRDAKTRAMREDVFARFGAEEAAWKAGLLRLHASQHARNLATRGHGFDERVLAVNRASADAAGWSGEWAEAFEVVRFGTGGDGMRL